MDLRELETCREGNRLEAKRAQGRDGKGELPQSVWETVSAFANTAGGVIVLGVGERRDGTLFVEGIEKADKVLDDFWNAALSKDKLSSRFLRDGDATKEVVDGKSIVVIRVPWVDRRMRPVFINDDIFDGTYRRTHTGDHRCEREEVLSMLRDSSASSPDSEVAGRARLVQLDRDTVAKYRRRFDSFNGGHVWSALDETEFLCAIGAAAEDDSGVVRPTFAGLMMFGEERFITKELPEYFLDYRQETGGNERWEDRVVSFSGDWTGNVFDFYFRVYNKMKQALKVPFQLEGISRIDDTPAHKALREALANCLTNMSAMERRGVTCVWRDEAIEIANPGDFRMPIEVARRPGSSDPRNATMLKMFSMVEVGERAGSGMDKIFDGWMWAGYGEPTYEVEHDPDRTTLTLPLTARESDTFDDGEKRQIPQGEQADSEPSGKKALSKRAVAEHLARHGQSKSADIANAVGLSVTRTNQLLREMVAEGAVIAEGAARSRTYRLGTPDL